MIRDFVFATSQPGIETRHMFSAGAHYDPENVSFGRVVGCDEHTVAPGAGFDQHAHRGVVIVSWVMSGTLRHTGSAGSLDVRPGEVLIQSTGNGIRHAEMNGGDDELVFIQTTLLSDVAQTLLLAPPPMSLPGGGLVRVGTPAESDFAVRAGAGVLVIEM